MLIKLYHNGASQLIDSWVCDDDDLLRILGDHSLLANSGPVLYYIYGGQYRLIVDLNVTSV